MQDPRGQPADSASSNERILRWFNLSHTMMYDTRKLRKLASVKGPMRVDESDRLTSARNAS